MIASTERVLLACLSLVALADVESVVSHDVER